MTSTIRCTGFGCQCENSNAIESHLTKLLPPLTTYYCYVYEHALVRVPCVCVRLHVRLRACAAGAEEDYPRLKDAAFRCIQNPGDIFYVPEGWSHGVHNLAESVGYALEFELTVTAMRRWDGNNGKRGSRGSDDGDGSARAGGMREALSRKRIKVLRKQLKAEYGDACDGCTEKSQYVDRIVELAAAAAEAGSGGTNGGGGGGDGRGAKDEL